MSKPRIDVEKHFWEHKDDVVEIIEAGGTIQDIANLIGCGKDKIYQAMKEHEDINDVIDIARRKPIKAINNKLLECAMGYDKVQVKTVVTTDREGNTTETTTTTTVHYPPSMRAIEMYLRGHDKDYRDSDYMTAKIKQQELKMKERELELKEKKQEQEAW